MSGFFETAFGPGALAVQIGLSSVALVVLVVGLVWLVRRSGARKRFDAQDGWQSRLAVMDSAIVDSKRRLLLVRRDNIEHLILIGGPADVVVEHGIGRSRKRASSPAKADVGQRAETATRASVASASGVDAGQAPATPRKAPKPLALSDDAISASMLAEISAPAETPQRPEPDETPRSDQDAAPPIDGEPAGLTATPVNLTEASAEAAKEPSAPHPPQPSDRREPSGRPRPEPGVGAGATGLAAGVAALAAAVRRNPPPGNGKSPSQGIATGSAQEVATKPDAESNGTDVASAPLSAAMADSKSTSAEVTRGPAADQVPEETTELRKAFGLRGKPPDKPTKPVADTAEAPAGASFEKPAGPAAKESAEQADDSSTESTTVEPSSPTAPPFVAVDDEPLQRERQRQTAAARASADAATAAPAAGTMTTLGDLAARLEEALARQSREGHTPAERSPAAAQQGASQIAAQAETTLPSDPPQKPSDPPQNELDAVAPAPSSPPASAAPIANGSEPPKAMQDAAAEENVEPQIEPADQAANDAAPDAARRAATDPAVIDLAGHRRPQPESIEDEMARLLGELTGDGAR